MRLRRSGPDEGDAAPQGQDHPYSDEEPGAGTVDRSPLLPDALGPIVLHERQAVAGDQRQAQSEHQLRKQRIDVKQVHGPRTLLLLAAGILLIACRAESRTIVSIDEAGFGSVEARVLLDDEAAAFVGRQDETPEDVAASLAVNLGSGAAGYQGTSRQISAGGLTGVAIAFDDLGPGDIEAILTEGGSVIDGVQISEEDGVLRFTAVAEPKEDDETRRLVDTAPAHIGDIVGMVLEVRVPGRLLSHNADRETGDGLEWDLLGSVLQAERIEAVVEAAVPPGFQLRAGAGPGSVNSPPAVIPENGSGSTPAWVWILPVVGGLATWLVIAGRSGRS